MKNLIAAGAVLAASIAPAAADLCSVGAKLINGNWYCQPVKAITYQGVGGSGSYNKVTHMDSSTGSCSSTPQRYSGSMAPYDDEVRLALAKIDDELLLNMHRRYPSTSVVRLL